MRLRKLILKNFRLHEDTTLDLHDTNFVIVRGRNASGKTSIAQALSLNLANTTMGLSSDGKGFASKISDGKKTAEIIAEIEGQHVLESMVTLSVGSAGRTQTVKCLDAPEETKAVKGFENFLNRYSDALKIACNTDYFSKMGEKEQKNLLAKLVLPSRYDFPTDKAEATNELLDDPIDFNGEPFSVIETAYKKLYKEREAINRQVKDFVIPDALPIPKGVDSASLQKELASIRGERAKLQKERDEAISKANQIEVQRATLQTKIDGLLRKVEDGKKRIQVLETGILPDLSKYKEIVSKEKEITELRKSHNCYLAGIRAANDEIRRLKSITDKGAICPTCEQEIDSSKIASLIQGLEKEIANGDQELQLLDKKIEAIGDIDAAKRAIEKHENAVKEKESITKDLIETVDEGKKTRAALNALPEAKDAKLPFNDPLGSLQAKEDKITEQLRPVIAAEERAKDIKAKQSQFESLEKKAKELDVLVKYFDKDGIKKTLIAEYIGGFQNKINSVLESWGYQASLSSDLSSFDVTTPRGYVGPVKEVSGAEEHIFKVAFQCSVSSAAGIKLVAIDEVEELGEDIRQNLFRSVFSLIQNGSLEQAILIGYSTDRSVPNPQAPGSSYWYVEDGIVERLDA